MTISVAGPGSFARKSVGIGSVGLKTDNGLFEKRNKELINDYRIGEKQCSKNDGQLVIHDCQLSES